MRLKKVFIHFHLLSCPSYYFNKNMSQPPRNEGHVEQNQVDPSILAPSIVPHHPVTFRHMSKPSPKEPNHPVKLHLTSAFWASPSEITWAVSEQLKLANTFILPLKFYICLLCSMTVPLVNWYSGLESACAKSIWFNLRIPIVFWISSIFSKHQTQPCSFSKCFRGKGMNY